jgi:hypothetical protein
MVLLNISARANLYCNGSNRSESVFSNIAEQDTIRERQLLYNGIIWKNMYHRIKDDQFLFSDYFLPGTVSINGQTFRNLKLRYDIYSDEILIPVNLEEIVQLNKEMVDSFTISFEDNVYKFTRFPEESLNGLVGYVNVLYEGKSALYVKYKKNISLSMSETTDGEFFQTNRIYFMKDSTAHLISRKNDFFRILNEDKIQLRNYIKKNKLKVSKKIPESFVPVLRFYDSLSQ